MLECPGPGAVEAEELKLREGKIAVITGAGGQDAYFLSRGLARRGIRVVGVTRPGGGKPAAATNLRFFEKLVGIDLRDGIRVASLVAELAPDFILNFGAIAGSLTQQGEAPGLVQVNTGAVAAILEAMHVEQSSAIFLQASSSEVFAGGSMSPQGLDTPRVPRTIYGATKIASDSLVRIFRQNHGLACFSVVFYSHESPLRKPSYFSKRIVAQVLDVVEGKADRVTVHSPDAVRDWGYAGEYCEALIDRLLAGLSGDLVMGTGTYTTVRQFATLVCNEVGLDYADIAHEVPLQEGRAMEGVKVVADPGAPGFCLTDGVRFDVKRLVRLLVRYERRARGTARRI